MKKVITLVLSLILSICMLTACGGSKTPEPTPTPSEKPASSPKVDANEDDYLEAMGIYIEGVEEYVAELDELMAISEDIETEADLEAWCDVFDAIKEAIGDAADELTDILEYAPDDYIESHAEIAIAVAAIYDAMTGFEDAVIAAVEGDQNAFEDGLVEFIGNMTAAEELWESAVSN